MSCDNIRFFTGTNSGNGFFSVFDKVYNIEDGWNAFLIKGGPGSGKSSLMKKLGAALSQEHGCQVHFIHCSSDPDSLDGIVLPQHNICMLDATPPHTLEPAYPGACEHIVNVTACWDSDKLYNEKDDIAALSTQCSSHHSTAQVYIKAAAAIEQNIYDKAEQYINTAKLQRYTENLCKKELGFDGGDTAKEQLRLLSAISPDGIMQYDRTPELLCGRIICINDEFGAVAAYMLKAIRDKALANGLEIISCLAPLQPKRLQHIIFPQLHLAVVSNSGRKKSGIRQDKNIFAKRFYDMDMLSLSKQKIIFGKRVINDLIMQAAQQMKQAKLIHDRLERHYINAMNFDMMDSLYDELLGKIVSLIK